MRGRKRSQHIVITDRDYGLPYSKGLMASSLSVSGLPAAEAFAIAERIEQKLLGEHRLEITSKELRDIAAGFLRERGERYADSYLKWQTVEELDVPLVILLGGATGVGKSTVATQLATRLGITRVVSTDAIREVLRSALSADLVPSLHVSSFNADVVAPVAVRNSSDAVLVGFQEQVQAVAVGIKGLIARALEEGTDIIVEGAHLVPGFLDGWEEEFKEAVLVPIVMCVGDEDLHRSHFHMRAIETKSRPHGKYLDSFEKIRLIQDHVNALAEERGVPVVEVFDLDSTIQEIVSLVVKKTLGAARDKGDMASNAPRAFSYGDNGEVVRKGRLSRVKHWEVLGRRRHS
ncbi:MAG TPA: AAA family ATPase [Actinomycetota bacterium]|nr:AAA family ATPase [Actinomycetota bacterium]